MKIYFKVQCIVSIAQEYSAHRPDQWTFLSARSAQILHYIHSPSVNRHISTSILWEKYGVVQGTSLTSCIHNVHLFWNFLSFWECECVCVCVGWCLLGFLGSRRSVWVGGIWEKKCGFQIPSWYVREVGRRFFLRFLGSHH